MHKFAYYAVRFVGYDSRKYNDMLGKAITLAALKSHRPIQNLMLLDNLSTLQLKPLYIEKVEKYCAEQLLI